MAEIKEVGDEWNDIMAGLSASVSGNQDNNPTEVPTPAAQVPAVEPTAATEPPKANDSEAVVEPPSEQKPVVEEPKEDGPWSDWDTPEVPTTTTQPAAQVPAPDIYSDLGKALGVEIKSQDDLIKAWKDREQAKLPDNIPSELKKAVELASKGVDYLEYLKINTVDYSKEDPVELYENYIIDQMANDKGEVDDEKVNEYLDSLSDMDKLIRGNEIKRQLTYAQGQRTAQLEQEALRAREKHDTELKSALRGFTEIDGFKVDDNHRRDLFDWISSGKIMQDLFYDANGQFDAVKASKVAFRTKYYDKLDAYQKTKIKNATKREILKDITNQDITSTRQVANPETRKDYGMADYLSQIEQQMFNR